MKLAILFWCYKRIEVCEDRLRLLRDENPGTPVYCLFGGEENEIEAYRERLGPLVDDFYAFRGGPPAGSEAMLSRFRGGVWWKYIYGDLLLGAWYRERGHQLEWDTVVVVQWDMLLYGPVEEAFACLDQGQILLSGLRPISEVKDDWGWTGAGEPAAQPMYEEFLAHVRERYGFDGDPMCCVAIVLALPREFLRGFSAIERPELGFLEYRLPIYAQAFGIPFCTEHPFRPWWGAVEKYHWAHTLRARPREIWAPTILWNLLREDGARVFHPYWAPAPRGVAGWTRTLLASLVRPLTTRLKMHWED
jgi:hypothetical protein